MGIFKKLTDIFYDNPDGEETNKKEVKKEINKDFNKEINDVTEELILPKELKKVRDEVIEEVKTDNTFSERELFRSERTFNFNEFDDEDDEPPRKTALDLEKRTTRVVEPTIPVVEKPKVFKPSPVISPVYGILDKDYTREDVSEKKETIKNNDLEKKDTNYDSVRRKAFGTLEDQLEDTMVKTPDDIKESVDNIEEEMDRLNDKTAKIEDLINRIENTSSVTIGELEDKAAEEAFEETEEVSYDEDKTMSDDTLEHDLFNLIDSMYDDKED